MSERDIVDRLRPRLTRQALELVADMIESDEAMGDGKDAAALRVVLAAYVAAPDASAEILRLRAQVAAKDAQIAALLKVKEAASISVNDRRGFESHQEMAAVICKEIRDVLAVYSEWEKTNADK